MRPRRVLLFRSGRHLRVSLDAIEGAWPGAHVTVVAAPSAATALEQAGIGPSARIVYDRARFQPLAFITSAAGGRALAGRFDQVAVLWNDPDGSGCGNVDRTALLVSPRGFVAITPSGSMIRRRTWPLVSRELIRAGWSLAVGTALLVLLFVPARLLRPFR